MSDASPCTDLACPYCGVLFKKPPQRKSKCPACKNFVFVRRSLSDPERRLVTEARDLAVYPDLVGKPLLLERVRSDEPAGAKRFHVAVVGVEVGARSSGRVPRVGQGAPGD